ncbi:MAG TPA: ribonuclease J [Bacilli bacterium]|nr:ribonuclease J [Bacilli bacterium]HQC84078.1 ribonuclease J [Bacilli bacterium]
MKEKDGVTSVFALGGLGEIGKNMYVVEHNDEIIIIDAGVMFPEDELLGVDYVIQDVTYLKQNEDKIKALIITHGHEDHIGGITFLETSVKIPVIYASQIAADLIIKKLNDKNMPTDNIVVYDKTTELKFKYMSVEFINTTHSIPDSFAIVIHTPNGVIVHTGDYKFDLTPIGPVADFHKMAKIGSEGVKLLLGESTNALSPGFSASESVVDEALGDIFSKEQTSRIILATFASNIYRIKHIVETCRENNRKIITFGRSMENAIDIAIKDGLIKDKSIFIEPSKAKDLKKQEICILCTGSQGEPLAALSRIANGTHKQVTLMPDDIIIFSSNPIPGNRTSVDHVINKLYLKGVRVYTNEDNESLHTSGHGKQMELELMLRLIKPEYFMPIHGEYRMLKKNIELAEMCGVPKDHSFLCQLGDVVELDKTSVHRAGKVQAGTVYVDGSRIGDVGSVVLKDRTLMSKDGILVTILNIDPVTHTLLIKPNITTRGFILVNENGQLIREIERKVSEIVNKELEHKYNVVDLKNQIILELNMFINQKTGRRPIILPVIMEVKKNKASNN